jgi:PKD repeat protein
MATTPFTLAFVDRLISREHAYMIGCQTGEIVQFKFYCCADPYNFTVLKTPVVVVSIPNDIMCVGDAVSANISNSYVPLGTADSWRIDWGDGTSNNGAWPPPAPVNKAAAYAAAGTYDIRITVTENGPPLTTGSLTVQVLVVDCTNDSVLADYMYVLSQTTGPWLRDLTVAGAPAWVQHVQNLPAGTWRNGRDLKIDPHRRHLPIAVRHVWIATEAGVAKSTDNMDHWMRLYDSMPEPRNTANDGIPPVKTDLDWHSIAFNQLRIDEVYVLAGTATRAWVYFTYDGGRTWDNWQCSW